MLWFLWFLWSRGEVCQVGMDRVRREFQPAEGADTVGLPPKVAGGGCGHRRLPGSCDREETRCHELQDAAARVGCKMPICLLFEVMLFLR